MQRTIRLQLKPTLEQAETLRETLRQNTVCFNFVAFHCFENKEENGVELHKATYDTLRETYPQLPSQLLSQLPSQLVCAARVKATEAIKSAFALRKKGQNVCCPISQSAPIRYDARSDGMRLDINAVPLATVKGRQIIEYSLYAASQRMPPVSVEQSNAARCTCWTPAQTQAFSNTSLIPFAGEVVELSSK